MNLNEKVKKEELKRSLYALFSQHGRILDVVALKLPSFKDRHGLYLVKCQLPVMLRGRCKTFHFMITNAERKRRAKEEQQSTTANGRRTDINGGPTTSSGKAGAQEGAADPNNILFIQNSPH